MPGIKSLATHYNRLQGELQIIRDAPNSYYYDQTLPAPIDIDKLFTLDPSDDLWQDATLELETDPASSLAR